MATRLPAMVMGAALLLGGCQDRPQEDASNPGSHNGVVSVRPAVNSNLAKSSSGEPKPKPHDSTSDLERALADLTEPLENWKRLEGDLLAEPQPILGSHVGKVVHCRGKVTAPGALDWTIRTDSGIDCIVSLAGSERPRLGIGVTPEAEVTGTIESIDPVKKVVRLKNAKIRVFDLLKPDPSTPKDRLIK